MEPDQGPVTFEAAQKTSRTFWFAGWVTVLFFGGLVWFLSQAWGPESKDVRPVMQWATIAVAIGAGSLSLWFQRIQYGPRKLAHLADGDETKAAGLFLTGHMIGWVLAELVAGCGFFLALLGQQMTYYLPFAVASFVLFTVERPDTGPYERAMREGGQTLTPPSTPF